MALEILQSILSSPSLKVVNKSTGSTVLVPMKAVKVFIKFPSRIPYHMKEDGNTTVDQRVRLPINIDMSVISPDSNTVKELANVFKDRSSIFQIQSRGVIVNDMRVNALSISQNPDMISATPIRVNMMQMLYQGQKTIVTFQAADSSLLDRGLAFVGAATSTVSGMVSKLKSAASSII